MKSKQKRISVKSTDLTEYGKQFGKEFSGSLPSWYNVTRKPIVKFKK